MANLSSRPQAKADKTEIKITAERLMSANGQTTTLHVKNHLRNRGFLAFQNEISNFMGELAGEHHWNHVHNGQFRIYSLPTIQQRTQSSNGTHHSQQRRISRPPSAHPRTNWVADLLKVSLN